MVTVAEGRGCWRAVRESRNDWSMQEMHVLLRDDPSSQLPGNKLGEEELGGEALVLDVQQFQDVIIALLQLSRSIQA